jgi:hypothetical protein
MILYCPDNFHCIEHSYSNANGSTSDFISYLALAISILSIVTTIFVVYLAKRVEIKVNKFNRLCLEPLESSFNSIFEHFDSYRNDSIHKHLKELFNACSDLTSQLVAIKSIYPKLDTAILQDRFSEFTDKAYANQSELFYTLQSDFLRVKIQILSEVYNYALEKETKFLIF